eukprot:TRINITY_DN5798_c0_g1_i1.p1 TRINITY_DN5798_c0_g1~~TRINITY_DN5798_c0_g1_i1.p1  ORF type:complete len:251 (-),score=73.32 TRINITY_DN5798_c0_g1_i1:13-765(-)
MNLSASIEAPIAKYTVGEKVMYATGSALLGAIFGTIIAASLAGTFIGISSPIGLYIMFAVMFFGLGLLMSYRLKRTKLLSPRSRRTSPRERAFLSSFLAFVWIAGFFTFLWGDPNLVAHAWQIRYPMGFVIAFIITFTMSFLFAKLIDNFYKLRPGGKSIIGTVKQLTVIVIAAMGLSAANAYLFTNNSLGLVPNPIKMLITDLPIGAGIGFVVGFANQLIGMSESGYYRLPANLGESTDNLGQSSDDLL